MSLMAGKLCLIDDHRSLIPHIDPYNSLSLCGICNEINAVFIPYKNNVSLINQLLSDLHWFKGKIILLPSSDKDLENLKIEIYENVEVINIHDYDFKNYYFDLETSNHIYSSPADWDLPLKRSFAILISIYNNFRKILLIDDDMYGLTENVIHQASYLLNKYKCVSCFIEDFPDTSVVGHLEKLSSLEIKCFISGSFIFLKPFEITSFFPQIYNEDWIFTIPCILNEEVCAINGIKQLKYNPFARSELVEFQEFGETIAEGLYALIHTDQISRKLEVGIWDEILSLRKLELNTLLKRFKNTDKEVFVKKAISQNNRIRSADCSEFIRLLDSDLLKWNILLKKSQSKDTNNIQKYKIFDDFPILI